MCFPLKINWQLKTHFPAPIFSANQTNKQTQKMWWGQQIQKKKEYVFQRIFWVPNKLPNDSYKCVWLGMWWSHSRWLNIFSSLATWTSHRWKEEFLIYPSYLRLILSMLFLQIALSYKDINYMKNLFPCSEFQNADRTHLTCYYYQDWKDTQNMYSISHIMHTCNIFNCIMPSTFGTVNPFSSSALIKL